MITKPVKIVFTAGQVAVLKVIIEELITRPAGNDVADILAQYVITDWYCRNAGRFVFVPERLRLTFTPPQAYALNHSLLKNSLFDCNAARLLARSLVRIIDPKI
jgi:hypothetical protein